MLHVDALSQYLLVMPVERSLDETLNQRICYMTKIYNYYKTLLKRTL